MSKILALILILLTANVFKFGSERHVSTNASEVMLSFNFNLSGPDKMPLNKNKVAYLEQMNHKTVTHILR